MGDLTTPETQASLSARLRAITDSLASEGGGDLTTAKFIFDLRAAAELLDGLDGLLVLILDKGHDRPFGEIEDAADDLREMLERANPEPRTEPPSFEEREEAVTAATDISRDELLDRGFEPEPTRPDVGDGWIVVAELTDQRLAPYDTFAAGRYVVITGRVVYQWGTRSPQNGDQLRQSEPAAREAAKALGIPLLRRREGEEWQVVE